VVIKEIYDVIRAGSCKWQVGRERGEIEMEKDTKCLSGGDFINDWEQWKQTVGQAIRTARKIGMPDKLIEIASVKVGDFLTERLCAESKEEALIKDLWSVATPQERTTLGKLLFKIMDKTTKEYSEKELDQPYWGY
jgi:hypothetical protein